MLEQAYHTVKNVLWVTREGELVGGELSVNVLESLPPKLFFSSLAAADL